MSEPRECCREAAKELNERLKPKRAYETVILSYDVIAQIIAKHCHAEPCPICGHDPADEMRSEERGLSGTLVAECESCHKQIPVPDDFPSLVCLCRECRECLAAEKTALSESLEKCGQPAAPRIPRWGMSLACVLPKGHDGDHKQGGNCFKHGEYVGTQCPKWPECVPAIADYAELRLASSRSAVEPQVRMLAFVVYNSGFPQSVFPSRSEADDYVKLKLADSPEVEIIETWLVPERSAVEPEKEKP